LETSLKFPDKELAVGFEIFNNEWALIHFVLFRILLLYNFNVKLKQLKKFKKVWRLAVYLMVI
jgi:hypothetical protein